MWLCKSPGLPLTPKDDADLVDAVDSLRRVCFRAIGSLYAPGDQPLVVYDPEIGNWVTTDGRIRQFSLEDRILELLERYGYAPKRELLILALKGEFKNLPREIHLDLIDLVRKQYTRKAQALNFLSFDAKPALLNAGVAAFSEAALPEMEKPNAKRAIELLVLRKDELVESLGPANYQILLVAADFAQRDDCPDP